MFGEEGSRKELVENAVRTEALGYSTYALADHHDFDILSPMPALAAAAQATTTLRLGTLVIDNDFRHPVELAKEAATLDVLSDGRLELGIGAGWHKPEYERLGIPFDPAGVRVDRLQEAIAVINGMFAEGPFSFSGEHYKVTELDGHPKPLQRPRPPLLIGGGGKRMLEIAAREADIVALVPRVTADGGDVEGDASAEATDRKIAWIRDAAGDRVDELELQTLVFNVRVTDDPLSAAEELAEEFSLPPKEVLESPFVLIGTVEEIIETLQVRRERFGISYATIQEGMEEFAPVVARLAGT